VLHLADLPVIKSLIVLLGGLLTYCLGLWKGKLEQAKLKVEIANLTHDLQQKQLAVETKSLAQVLVIVTNELKKQQGTMSLVFSEDTLRNMLGDNAPRLHAALALLESEGRAKQTVAGGWSIGRS
jgi:hypothetical protein